MPSNPEIIREVAKRSGLPIDQIELFEQTLHRSIYDKLSQPETLCGGELLINLFGAFKLNRKKIATIIEKTKDEEIRERLTKIYDSNYPEPKIEEH